MNSVYRFFRGEVIIFSFGVVGFWEEVEGKEKRNQKIKRAAISVIESFPEFRSICGSGGQHARLQKMSLLLGAPHRNNPGCFEVRLLTKT